jgi:hypothetical protein
LGAVRQTAKVCVAGKVENGARRKEGLYVYLCGIARC